MVANFWSWISSIRIGDIPSALLGGLIGFILVFIVEWIRNPKIKLKIAKAIDIPEREIERDGKKVKIPKRKILKLEVNAVNDWRKYLPISKNIHAFSKVKVALDWKKKSSYQAKWDNAPEPFDYILGVPRLEMIPATMQPENLMAGDTPQAGIAVKYEGQDGFYFFDADYYVNPQISLCTKKRAELKITFKSSLKEKTENFILKNPDSNLDKFILVKESGMRDLFSLLVFCPHN